MHLCGRKSTASCPLSAWKLNIIKVLRRLLKNQGRRGSVPGVSWGPSRTAYCLNGAVPTKPVGEDLFESHRVWPERRRVVTGETLSVIPYSRTTFVLRDSSLSSSRTISLLLNPAQNLPSRTFSSPAGYFCNETNWVQG